MSLQNYNIAKLMLEEGDGDFEGPKSESLIASAEGALGVTFPPSYRSFLQDFGCGDINGFEVYGLIDQNFVTSGIPNAVWITLLERSERALDNSYILVGDGGDGSYFAIDTSHEGEDGENPVVNVSPDGEYVQHVAESFGSYLLNAIQGRA